MSRRNARKAQNAGSLIRPSAVVILCEIALEPGGVKCGKYAIRCYDLEMNRVKDMCREHAKAHGYCVKCGNQLTEMERRGMGPGFGTGLCGACRMPREPHYADFDDDWPDEEYDE